MVSVKGSQHVADMHSDVHARGAACWLSSSVPIQSIECAHQRSVRVILKVQRQARVNEVRVKIVNSISYTSLESVIEVVYDLLIVRGLVGAKLNQTRDISTSACRTTRA